MFKKVVSFVITERDVIRVINSIARYGIVTIGTILKGNVVAAYAITIECEKNNLQDCLSKLMELSARRVSIQKLNVTTRI
jgi:hypothetical protein